MSVIKKPDLSDPKLRAKLAKGMGHNYYGEPAWPNDLLYIFPVVIFGTFACLIGLSVLEPSSFGEKANPFATPLEILPEWYFFVTCGVYRFSPIFSFITFPPSLFSNLKFVERENFLLLAFAFFTEVAGNSMDSGKHKTFLLLQFVLDVRKKHSETIKHVYNGTQN